MCRQILGCDFRDRLQCCLNRDIVTRRLHLLQTGHLPDFERAEIRRRDDRWILTIGEAIHANHYRFAGFHPELVFIRTAPDFLLKKAGANRGGGTAKCIDPLEEFERAGLDFIGELLHIPTAGQRIGGLRNARFVAHDLLRAQRQRGGGGRGQGQCFVVAVGMKRLRAAQRGGQRLHRHAHHIVERLLRGKRDTAGLRVEAQLATGIVGTETVAHEARPQASGRTKLRDLLEQVAVRGEKE